MHIWFAAFCGLVLCGCSAVHTDAIRDGVPALVSSRKNVVFRRPLTSHQVSYDRPRFVVALLNQGKAAAILKVSDIVVESTRPPPARISPHHGPGDNFAELNCSLTGPHTALRVGSTLGGAAAYPETNTFSGDRPGACAAVARVPTCSILARDHAT